jgi:hypothetical protein
VTATSSMAILAMVAGRLVMPPVHPNLNLKISDEDGALKDTKIFR